MYDELISLFPLKPIKSEDDLDKAEKIAESLIDKGNLTEDEKDYLDVLCLIVEQYESIHYPIPTVSPIDVINHLMKTNKLKQRDMIDVFKTESIVSDVLNGKRELTVEHIQKLSNKFKVNPAVFFN